jgi:hypothetical protein
VPKFSAIIYAESGDHDDLSRTLESVQICNEVLLINADSDDQIRNIGRENHARIKNGLPSVTPGAYLMDAFNDWVLVLRPGESVSNELRTSLKDWEHQKRDDNPGFRFTVLKHEDGNWRQCSPELRLVNRRKINWMGEMPSTTDAPTLRGPILRNTFRSQPQKAPGNARYPVCPWSLDT